MVSSLLENKTALTPPQDTNPYESPATTSDAVHRRTRWRIAAVTLFLVFGTVGLLTTPILLVIANNRPSEYGGGITFMRVVGVSLNAVGALLLLASGVLCWRGRWLYTCIGVALAFLAGFLANQLLEDLNL